MIMIKLTFDILGLKIFLFRLLVTKERPDEVSFQHFEGLLSEFKPRASKSLMFKINFTLRKILPDSSYFSSN